MLQERQKDALLRYQRAAAAPGDPAVRDWAERQLDVLRDQQSAGEQLLSRDRGPSQLPKARAHRVGQAAQR